MITPVARQGSEKSRCPMRKDFKQPLIFCLVVRSVVFDKDCRSDLLRLKALVGQSPQQKPRAEHEGVIATDGRDTTADKTSARARIQKREEVFSGLLSFWVKPIFAKDRNKPSAASSPVCGQGFGQLYCAVALAAVAKILAPHH